MLSLRTSCYYVKVDKLDREIRKSLLKPLVRRLQGSVDRKALGDAHRKLEERALGEHYVGKLRSYLKSREAKKIKRSWQDPERAQEIVSIAKILYAARHISKAEYVLHADVAVEDVQFGRLDKDEDIKPINKKIDKIREKHGLKPDEDWLVGTGPKEYIKLNKQWEEISESKFIESLREFGLDDLAELKIKDRDQYDQLRERGRRAVHHRKEQVPAIKDIVIRYEEEARRAATVNAYSSAVISVGSAIEGLLIIRCLKSQRKAIRIADSLTKRIKPSVRIRKEPIAWKFETLIEVCYQAGWLPPIETEGAKFNAGQLAHILRQMRNLVHPGRHVRERPWITIDRRDYDDAEAIYKVLRSTSIRGH